MGDDVMHPSLHNSAFVRKRRYALEGFVLTNPLRNAFALAIVSIYFTIYRRAMDKEIHGSRSLLDKYKSPPECLSFVYSTKGKSRHNTSLPCYLLIAAYDVTKENTTI